MKVFADECVNRHLLRHLTGHTFVHARDTPFRSTRNGALLRAVSPDYDVFLTRDQGIPFQQNLRRFPLAFIILRAHSNKIEDLLPLVPTLLATLERIEPAATRPATFTKRRRDREKVESRVSACACCGVRGFCYHTRTV